MNMHMHGDGVFAHARTRTHVRAPGKPSRARLTELNCMGTTKSTMAGGVVPRDMVVAAFAKGAAISRLDTNWLQDAMDRQGEGSR